MSKHRGIVSTALVALLSTYALSAEPKQRLELRNKGDSVEIRQVEDKKAPVADEDAAVVLSATETFRDVVSRYESSLRKPEMEACLRWIADRPPRTAADAQALLHMYDRNDAYARDAVESSLRKLTPADQTLSSFFLSLLEDSEPGFQLFGVAGARQLHSPSMYKPLRKIASRPFPKPRPALEAGPAMALQWKLQFEALRALCDWQDAPERSSLPGLLVKKAGEAPAVAGLFAQYFWPQAFPKVVRWSESSDPLDQERAAAAWSANTPPQELLGTWNGLWAVVKDGRKRFETRHQAALKLGLGSGEAQVDKLLKARQEAKDSQERLLLTAALFASRSPKVIPLLVEYVKTDPTPTSRAGALIQLKDMMPKEEFHALLQWVLAHDKDAENRSLAQRELSAP